MKNKGVTYGLIVVVGIIWYQVFIRVKSNVLTDEESQNLNVPGVVKQVFKKRETFDLAADYRDPFTGNFTSDESTSGAALNSGAGIQPPAEPKPLKPSPPPFNWPSIKYFGMVRETKSSKPLTVLAIDGEYYKLRQGESALDDIFIKRTYRDSVLVIYRKRSRMFYR